MVYALCRWTSDPITTLWDVAELEALIGPRTRAVVLTHLFWGDPGWCATP